MSNFIRLLQNRQLDKCWTDTRFKKLDCNYQHFYFPQHLYDIVETEEFQRIEEKRIPLFLGTQFGLFPDIQKHFSDGGNGILVGILCKSLLSGCVAGVKITYYRNNSFTELSFWKA